MTNQLPAYLRVREASASKLGQRASGAIRYAVLTNEERTEVYLTVTANDGGGQWSREAVPLRDIEEALSGVAEGSTFAAKRLCGAFVGKSTNNAGFLAAVLRAESLVAPAGKYQFVVDGDWDEWKRTVLAAPSQPFPVAAPADEKATTAAPAVANKAQRRSRRGGNRLIPVGDEADSGGGSDAADF